MHVVVGVCYSPPDQKVNGAFFRQLEETSHLQVLVLMRDFNYSNIFWRGNTIGTRQFRTIS